MTTLCDACKYYVTPIAHEFYSRCSNCGAMMPKVRSAAFAAEVQRLADEHEQETFSPLACDTATFNAAAFLGVYTPNPKTVMGRRKVPMLSVIPPASLIYEALAMDYGAHDAPRADGDNGYGPYNWRDDPVELLIYIDACMRHLMAVVDGEDLDPTSHKPHIGHAKACLGILADATENGTLIDDRPKNKQAASRLLAKWTKSFNEGDEK